ncbi:MAG: type II CRISPR-associated endonuclease Cas1 [Kiritimatiellae bacterium]|nr:type II CRISPR-associated endonuclease Cas1 [Kiritimatiellia bacterium]
MSYHFVDISESGAVVSVKDRQLVCKTKDGTSRSIPLEDAGAVLVTAFSALLHNSFLVEAAKSKTAVVFCERFRPVSILLPVSRGADTLLTRAQISSSTRLREAVWRKTVDAKLANQFSLLTELSAEEKLLEEFRCCARRIDPGREGNCARIYWNGIAVRLGREGFRRGREGDGLNALLNYGYGVLLTRILQRLLATGLDPMYGVGHAVRERAAPLAYDLMEPFRPAFDRAVVQWGEICLAEGRPLDVNADFKRAVLGVLQSRHPMEKGPTVSVDVAIERTIASLKSAFLSGKPTAYKPWTRRSSRWDG